MTVQVEIIRKFNSALSFLSRDFLISIDLRALSVSDSTPRLFEAATFPDPRSVTIEKIGIRRTHATIAWRESRLIKSRCFTVSASRTGQSRSVER